MNRVTGSDNKDLVYHFHGRNGAADWWNDQTYYSAEIYQHWKSSRSPAPTVVTVSFGKLWILLNEPEGLLPFFTDTVMPRIEREVPSVGRRFLIGESMGGVNALMMAFHAGKKFEKVAALCPPLPTIPPDASFSEISAYARRTGTAWKRVSLLWLFSRAFYPQREIWERNDPVQVSERATEIPSLYLSCGEKDAWGCMEGSLKVAENLRKANQAVQWVPRPGGHCDVDTESVAAFLH